VTKRGRERETERTYRFDSKKRPRFQCIRENIWVFLMTPKSLLKIFAQFSGDTIGRERSQPLPSDCSSFYIRIEGRILK
jgi:hypothetical protein